MFSSPNAAWFSGIAAPLTSRFGTDLTVSRSGNMVCWGYDGQSVHLELAANGSLHATFLDCERIDAVSSAPVVAAYQTGSTYGLDGPSGRRMITDMVDFFSGIREPRFTFIDAHPR